MPPSVICHPAEVIFEMIFPPLHPDEGGTRFSLRPRRDAMLSWPGHCTEMRWIFCCRRRHGERRRRRTERTRLVTNSHKTPAVLYQCLHLRSPRLVHLHHAVPPTMLPLVSGINSRLLSGNHALVSPILHHPVVRVALPLSAPSTHHSIIHHPFTISLQA